MRVGVVGATGTIGRPLVEALAAAGHDVVAVSRRGGVDAPGVDAVAADAGDAPALARALDGCEVVHHLVHSLGAPDFDARDRAAAEAVASAAAAGGARQIVYLGGIGGDATASSPHLRSRQETAEVLAHGPVPVTVLGAAMVVGEGSAAFETIRALVERLPVMVCPRWVTVETQPVALADVVAALVAVAGLSDAFGQSYDVGGPEVMTYRSMMERTARALGRKPRLIVVPLLTPRLSSLWLHLVTPVNAAVTRPLVEGMKVPTVARDSRIWTLVGIEPMSFDEAVRRTLDGSSRNRKR